MKKFINIFLLVSIPFLLVNCQKKETIEEEAEQWKPLEISFLLEKENPYLDADVTGVFVHENGKDSLTTKAFWYEADTFKIRFTPTLPGKWDYEIREGNNSLKQGIIHATDASRDNHGFVRRDAAHPYHFIYDDSTRYYMFGTTYYNMVLNAVAGDRWKTAIDSALLVGINKMRVFANSEKSEKTPYPRVHPFVEQPDTLDYTRLNPDYWKALDRIVQYSFEKGMLVDLIMLGYGAETYATPALDQQYIRYLLARYAAYPNIIWCLTNEWNYIYRDYGRGKPYWNTLGRMVRNEDPYMEFNGQLRPLSIHQQTRVDFQFFNYEWPVHAIVQLGVRNGQGTVKDEWDDTDPEFKTATKFGDEWGNYSITYNLGHNMPVVNDEFGYIGEPRDKSEATSSDRSTWPRFTREKHRNVMWGVATAGGYGATGDKNEYADGHPYFSANWHSDPPEYRDVKVLVDFFASGDIDYWKMESTNDIVRKGERVYALAEPGKQYLFYSAAGNSFEANLEPGTYAVWRINPISGERETLEDLQSDYLKQTLDGTQDWVIFLKSLNLEVVP